ncbi:glycosyl hydrolase family 28 protein [Mucilaginibacter sp. RS28]|uniref:Glycosyl hydrolase family 28 protein n=1 Tax=Mucilaginibacter straminoryzae TaxID=2932774 RepID=A0A9X1X3N7_9SPHI|nr:glycosyl hydrolase family 28 protein [Mucilaginibacter straminoryzae]MCJ8209720.1 glycosyl hydrolase family 28 protein [Mucilaginibacter straminoryzae]
MKFLNISLMLLLPFAVNAQTKVSIVDYGAKSDGKTNNAQAIQKAIDETSAKGGGTVVIPAGRFLTAPINLKSGVNLFVSEKGVLLGSDKRLDYSSGNALPLISANGQHDISITGPGTIDGQGDLILEDLLRLLKAGTLQDATWQKYNPWRQKQPEERNRPKLVLFRDCNNIKIKHVFMKNALDWVQDYRNCENLVVDSMKVESNTYWNNDGIDIVDCRNVKVTNSFFNADDDGICFKSENRQHYCDNIYVANCKVRSSASAIKFGTASHGGFKNVKLENIEIYDTYRSAIAIESVDGGFLEDITIKNINARNTGNAIFIRTGHRNQDSVSSYIKKVFISNVNVQVPAGKPDKGYPMEGPPVPGEHHVFPCVIAGLPGHPVSDVTIENVKVTYEGGYDQKIPTISLDSLHTIPEKPADYPEFSMFGELPAWALYVRHAENLTFKSTTFDYQKADPRAACVFDDVKGLHLEDFTVKKAKTNPVMVLKDVKNESFKGLQIPGDKKVAIKRIN